jgi:rhodanese-related sulfurtransferase
MFGRDKTEVDVVTASQMAANDGYVILDVRTANERAEGFPLGSIHMVLETIPQRFSELEGKKVLAFCRSGSRSAAAARFLAQQDIEAHNVRGGILAWSRAGLPLKEGYQE